MFAKLLGKPRFLDADLEDWSFETWAFLLRECGGVERLRQVPWVTPSKAFFPPSHAEGEARALEVFEIVKAWMGMADWPCHLRTYERPESHQLVSQFVAVQTATAPNGLFWVGGGEAQIEYAIDLIARPMHLVATFAHELSHYRLAKVEAEAPGGERAHELTTELCVAYSGFGLFAANAAFDFSQHGDAFSQGWRSERSGYLSERAWAFSLAMFGVLKGEPAPEAYLKPGVLKMVRAAEKHLARFPERMAALEAIA
jgi:hypothetical protein